MVTSGKEYLLVTEYFYPDTASTGQLMTDLAAGLKEKGMDIKVYTSQPNYHSGENEKQPRLSLHKNVPVFRIRAPQVRQSSLVRRLFNWTIFIAWMFIALLLDNSRNNREVIFVSITPFLPLVVSLVCRIKKWDYTYIAYDLYPDQAVELDYIAKGGIVERIWRQLENSVLVSANNIVVNGELMKERLLKNARGKVDPTTVEIIHNWADGEFLKPRPKAENPFSQKHNLVEPFTILYSGNIGEFHDLETLIKAAVRFDEDVQILIIGEGDKKKSLIRLAESLGVLENSVRFLPYQSWDDLPYSLTSGDVSVVAVQEGFEGVCVSSKIYSAMAAGTPILCIAKPFDDEARLVDQFDMGFHVSQGDIEGIVETIELWRSSEGLLEKQGQNARTAFESNFTKEKCINNYYQLLADQNTTRSNV